LSHRAMSSAGGFTSRTSSSPGRPHSSHPEALRSTSRVRERLGGTAVLRLAGLLALIATALFALGAGSASAATVRPYESQITEADGTPFAERLTNVGLWLASAERIRLRLLARLRLTGLTVDNSDDSIRSTSSALARTRSSHPEASRPCSRVRGCKVTDTGLSSIDKFDSLGASV
jgi:hypothetical protein